MNDNEIEFYVRFNEQDDMGIVHNSVYYIWFEMARNNFAYHILDADYQELKKMGIVLPVIHSECNYEKPARFGDRISVTCLYEPCEKNILKLHYIVRNAISKDILAVGVTENVFTTLDGKLLIERPQVFEKAFKRIPDEYVYKKAGVF